MPVVDSLRLRRVVTRPLAGHAMIELALIGPWLFLLFAVILNFGLFMYAGISVANAARAAAVEAGRNESTLEACDVVKAELSYLPNIAGADCAAGTPLRVTPSITATGTTPDGNGKSAIVTVTYAHPALFLLPGMSPNFTITRTAEVRVFK